jgi:hypothetical protein
LKPTADVGAVTPPGEAVGVAGAVGEGALDAPGDPAGPPDADGDAPAGPVDAPAPAAFDASAPELGAVQTPTGVSGAGVGQGVAVGEVAAPVDAVVADVPGHAMDGAATPPVAGEVAGVLPAPPHAATVTTSTRAALAARIPSAILMPVRRGRL